MRLATFTHGGATRVGVVDGDTVIDLAAAQPSLPRQMLGFLAAGQPAMDAARAALTRAALTRAALTRDAPRLPLADVRLEAPIARPPKFLAIGLNYADHIRETRREKPEFPVFFNKQSTCVTGPYDPIQMPKVSVELDYEGEMGFVIGRRCREVPRGRAHEVVAGFLVVDDVSVRDWQFRAPTMTLGKSFDTHGPIGPWIVTLDEIGDPHTLDLTTFVNGERRQRSNTRELIFDCWAIVELLSTVFTLEPGDVISTGTPGGVGGPKRKFLQVGDVVRVEIDRIGHIENRVVAAP